MYFYETYERLKNNPIGNTSSGELSYDDIMGHLAYLEICKVLRDIQDYMVKAIHFISLINSGEPELEQIQKFLISVPDLENTLQLSIPNLYIENQDIDVKVGESSSADKRSRDMLFHKAEIELCRDFEIQGFSEPSSGEYSADSAPTYTYESYNGINDVITYTKNTRSISRPFTLEFFIDLYNVQNDPELKDNMKQIIEDKIETIKDLIGIKDFVCNLTLSEPFYTVEEGNEEEEEGDKDKKGEYKGDGDDEGTGSDQQGNENKRQRRGSRKGPSSPEKTGTSSTNPPRSAQKGAVDAGGGEDISSHHVDTDDEVVVVKLPPDTGTARSRGIFGTDYREQQQPGGTKLKRKQTRRVKKKLRNTINKISKMTHKNKTKRRRKNRHKTRKS